MAKRLDKSALVTIAKVLKLDIQSTMNEGSRECSEWVYGSSRALGLVIEELGHTGLNPFDGNDWNVIVGEA